MIFEPIANSATVEMRGRIDAIDKRIEYHERALADAIEAQQDAQTSIASLTALRADYVRIIDHANSPRVVNVYSGGEAKSLCHGAADTHDR